MSDLSREASWQRPPEYVRQTRWVSARSSPGEAPKLASDSPRTRNTWISSPGSRNRLATHQFPFVAHLVVITGGQSNVADQAFWLHWSPNASQIELTGGHDIYNSQPQAVADQIFSLLAQ
jgi:hypothetical protein